MTKTSGEIEKELIDALAVISGKELDFWLKAIKDSGMQGRQKIVAWLKQEKGFGHMSASLLFGIYQNGGKPVYDSEKSKGNDHLLAMRFFT